ncbi:MAG: MFS transporter [Pseudomonadota bacterium]
MPENSGALRPLDITIPAILGVYTTQSLVGGFTFIGLPSVLRDQGVSLELIGFVSLLMVPWALKFLWSPIVERWRQPAGRQRRTRAVIFAGQLVVTATFAAIAFSEPSAFIVLGIAVVAMAFVSASVDIACDGFTIENLPGRKRGLGNIAQVGGGYLGYVLGSGLFLFLVTRSGWTVSMLAMAVLVLVGTLPFLRVGREDKSIADPATPGSRPGIWNALRNPLVRSGVAISILFEIGIRLVMPLTSLYLIDRGAPLEWIGALNGVGGAAAGVIGTFLGGYIVMKWGSRNALKIALALQFVTLVALAVAASFDLGIAVLAVIIIISLGIMALGFVSVYSMTMGLASLQQAGVDFSLFQSVGALTAAILGFSAAQIAHATGYAVCFGLAAAASLVALTTIPLLLKRIDTIEGA